MKKNVDLVKSSQFSNEGIAEAARVQRASLGIPDSVDPKMVPLHPDKAYAAGKSPAGKYTYAELKQKIAAMRDAGQPLNSKREYQLWVRNNCSYAAVKADRTAQADVKRAKSPKTRYVKTV